MKHPTKPKQSKEEYMREFYAEVDQIRKQRHKKLESDLNGIIIFGVIVLIILAGISAFISQ